MKKYKKKFQNTFFKKKRRRRKEKGGKKENENEKEEKGLILTNTQTLVPQSGPQTTLRYQKPCRSVACRRAERAGRFSGKNR